MLCRGTGAGREIRGLEKSVKEKEGRLGEWLWSEISNLGGDDSFLF